MAKWNWEKANWGKFKFSSDKKLEEDYKNISYILPPSISRKDKVIFNELVNLISDEIIYTSEIEGVHLD